MPSHGKPPRYDVLIRTFNSERTLAETLATVSAQKLPPDRLIIVDSGSTDATLALLPADAILHRYSGQSFNYSRALNQGLAYATADYVLVISSHTTLTNPEAMAYCLGLLETDPGLGGAYFIPSLTGEMKLGHERITLANFDGSNGMWNTCGVYRRALLEKRRFRPEVPTAEDHEWTRWLFDHEGLAVARISGGGMKYNKPGGYSLEARLREMGSVALYAKPEMRRIPFIIRVAYRVVRIHPWQKSRNRLFYFKFLGFLLTHFDWRHPW